ncbi:hypothetical protein B0H19DRAFT_1371339 [Mycena capillaripes]|nr:hypothetical protein B0H19DRAFT_1371339 [Mycena capillaripes]
MFSCGYRDVLSCEFFTRHLPALHSAPTSPSLFNPRLPCIKAATTADHDTDTGFAQFEGSHRGAGGGLAIPGVPTPSYMTRARSNFHNAGAAFPHNSPELENRENV